MNSWPLHHFVVSHRTTSYQSYHIYKTTTTLTQRRIEQRQKNKSLKNNVYIPGASKISKGFQLRLWSVASKPLMFKHHLLYLLLTKTLHHWLYCIWLQCSISALMTEIRPCIWRFIRIASFAGISEFQATALGGTMTHSNPRHLSRLKYEDGIGKDWGNLGAERWFWKCCTLRMAYLDDTPHQLWHCAATICPWNATTFVPSGHLLWIESCWHPGSSGHQGRHPPGAPSCHNLKALKPFQHRIVNTVGTLRCCQPVHARISFFAWNLQLWKCLSCERLDSYRFLRISAHLYISLASYPRVAAWPAPHSTE